MQVGHRWQPILSLAAHSISAIRSGEVSQALLSLALTLNTRKRNTKEPALAGYISSVLNHEGTTTMKNGCSPPCSGMLLHSPWDLRLSAPARALSGTVVT